MRLTYSLNKAMVNRCYFDFYCFLLAISRLVIVVQPRTLSTLRRTQLKESRPTSFNPSSDSTLTDI